MNCNFNTALTQSYHSQSQIIRILTESWVSEYMYCPHCGNASLNHFPNNKAVADFYCPNCNNEYELKSKAGSIGHKIADGAYHTFIDRITSNNNPDFFILNYSKQLLTVNNLWLIPKHFFVPDIIEQRKPLSDNAQRKGWIGCNILIDKIPSQAKIDIIHNCTPRAGSGASTTGILIIYGQPKLQRLAFRYIKLCEQHQNRNVFVI